MKSLLKILLFLLTINASAQISDTFEIKGKVIDFENVDLGQNWGYKWLQAFDGTGMSIDTLPWGWDGKNNAYIVDATGRNTSQALRIYVLDGCEQNYDTPDKCDTVSMDIYVNTNTGWDDAYFSYNFKVSPGFQGGEAGGKFNGLHSYDFNDEGEHDVYLMFNPGDSSLKWYIYDRKTPGYGESRSTNFKFLTGKWYNITMRVFFDDSGTDYAGFTELFIDGKHISTSTGWEFVGTGEPRGIQNFDIAFFFGGGGVSTADVWLEYDDIVLWRPTELARSGMFCFSLEGTPTPAGSIIPLPNNAYYNKWYHITDDNYFNSVEDVYYYGKPKPKNNGVIGIPKSNGINGRFLENQ